jgi:putative intracellular protease/amidase
VPRADVLVVPGADSATDMRDEPETLAWVRAVHAATTWTTSVCTGSLILGAAGILSGLKATTHWAAHDRLLLFGAEPTRSRVVEAGKVITAAGVSAGIDMALVLAAKLAGQKIGCGLQLAIEYDPAPPFDSGSPDKAPDSLVARVSTRLRANFQYPDAVPVATRCISPADASSNLGSRTIDQGYRYALDRLGEREIKRDGGERPIHAAGV